MTDDRLTPEERAVIEAAVKFASCTVGRADLGHPLIEAVDAYRKATAPPEPFEAFLFMYEDGDRSVNVHMTQPCNRTTQCWRCTVTPVERVR